MPSNVVCHHLVMLGLRVVNDVPLAFGWLIPARCRWRGANVHTACLRGIEDTVSIGIQRPSCISAGGGQGVFVNQSGVHGQCFMP